MADVFRPLLAAVAMVAALPAAAQTPPAPSEQMTVAAFMDRVAELRRGGPEWTLSPEASELFAVVSSVGQAYRQTLTERMASGLPTEACLPPEAEIDSDLLFAHFGAYSADQAAQTTIAAAFADLVRQRFPCT